MSDRFIVLARTGISRRRVIADTIARTTNLTTVKECKTASILAERSSATVNSNSVVIGPLFMRSAGRVIDEDAAQETVSSPAAFLERRWGSYIAIFDDGDRGIRVMREPSGALSCYYRFRADCVAIASDLDLLIRALGPVAGLNWTEIARSLVEIDLRASATAFSDVRELLPGELLSITPSATIVTQCWSPWDHIRKATPGSFDDQAAQLRKVVGASIDAFAARYEKVIASVSGGLDSSIVALSVAGRTKLTCVTLSTEDPSGDERRYARLVSEAVSSELVVKTLDPTSVDLTVSQAAHLPRTIGRPFIRPMIQGFSDAIGGAAAEALFNGSGGDNVFCYLQSATPALDRLMSGDPVGACRTIADIAAITGASYGTIISAILNRVGSAWKPRPWVRDLTFVNSELNDRIAPFAHPWLERPKRSLPGQRAHIAMLLRVQNYLDPWNSEQPYAVVNPLLAQPIVECCLSIPSWRWCQGGQDRAIARRAFDDILPIAVRQRRWKGGPDGLVVEIVDHHRREIRSMLIEGLLAQHGIIDRAQVVATLDNPRPSSATEALRLLMLVDAEAWVRTHG